MGCYSLQKLCSKLTKSFSVLPFVLAGEPEVKEIRSGETLEEMNKDKGKDKDKDKDKDKYKGKDNNKDKDKGEDICIAEQ